MFASEFKDHFSGHANLYAKFRPTYPDALFTYLASLPPDKKIAWDVGTGNGQAAVSLARHFKKIIATDASLDQIQAATAHTNVMYKVESAEKSSLDSATVSLVTIAQALHWLNFDLFFAEVKRVLKPGGIFAAWTYVLFSDGKFPELNRLLDHYYRAIVGEYWPSERRHVESSYKTIPFPFHEITPPAFVMHTPWTMHHVVGYLNSWSASQRFTKDKGFAPTDLILEELKKIWGDAETVHELIWPLSLKVGKV